MLGVWPHRGGSGGEGAQRSRAAAAAAVPRTRPARSGRLDALSLSSPITLSPRVLIPLTSMKKVPMAREGCGAGADRRFALLVAHPRRCRQLVEAAGAQRAANETTLTPDTCRKMQARQGALRSPSAIARSPIVLKQPAASKQGVAAGAPSLPARTGPCSHCSAPRRCHAGPALPGACSRHASGPWGRLEQASAAAADALWRRLAWALQLASGAAPTAPLPLLLASAGLLAAAHAGSGKDIWGIDTLVNYPPCATAGGGRRRR